MERVLPREGGAELGKVFPEPGQQSEGRVLRTGMKQFTEKELPGWTPSRRSVGPFPRLREQTPLWEKACPHVSS